MIMVQMVARTREAASELERLIAASAQKIRAARMSGEDAREAEIALVRLETEYDRLLSEMEKLLDELDVVAASPLSLDGSASLTSDNDAGELS